MERRVAVRAIIVNDGKLFCVKLKPYKEAIISGFWCTIGGGVDSGEPLIAALTREVFEETGITPVVGSLLYVQQFSDKPSKEHLEFFFHVTTADDFLNVDLSETTHGAEEIAELGFITVSDKVVYPEFLKHEDFSNLENQPTKFFSSL